MAINFEIVFSSQRTACSLCGARHGVAKILTYAGHDVSDGNYFKCHACGAAHTPKDDGSLRKGGIYSEAPFSSSSHSIPPPPSAQSVSLRSTEQRTVAEEFFRATLHHATTHTLAQYLHTKFGEHIIEHLRTWRVGGDAWGSTVFHYFDADGQHINAKSVLYSTSGKRDKAGFRVQYTNQTDETKEFPFVFGIRTAFDAENGLSRFQYFTKKRGYGQCLYGLWLLPTQPQATIIVCESEKTAVIGSFVMPDFSWIAIGGASGLTHEKAMALAQHKEHPEYVSRRVVVCFDADAAGIERTQQAVSMLHECGIDALGEVHGVPMPLYLFDAAPHDGYDLADYFLEQAHRWKGTDDEG